MSKPVLVLTVLIAFSGAQSALDECFTEKSAPAETVAPLKSGLYDGQQQFSLDLLHAINRMQPHDNLFFSPFSTYHALLITYFLTANRTENELKTVLHLGQGQTKLSVYDAYRSDKLTQLKRTVSHANYDFTNANKIYVSDQVPVRSCIAEKFPEEYQSVDFRRDPEAARSQINRWVSLNTHHMIQDLLPSGTIDQMTNLVLVNAAYFKGIWKSKFDPNNTKPNIFYVSSTKQIFVEMMNMEGVFNHDVSEELQAHILEMPYKGDDISMYILLPPFTSNSSIDYTLKHLTLEAFQSLVDENLLVPKTVNVSLPKFTLEHTIELVPALGKLGVSALFGPDGDFSTLVSRDGDTKVMLGSALHKARIQVTEEGTKAAAATAFFTFRSSRPLEPTVFNCNHPFVYLIYDKMTKSILFGGVFRKPY